MNAKDSFFQIVRRGDVEAARAEIVTNPTCVLESQDNGWTPLHMVAAQGVNATQNHAEIAELLIGAGADLHARDIARQTPLHLISVNGSVESIPVARVLLAAGAPPLEKNIMGMDCTFVVHGKEVRKLMQDAVALR